MVGAAAAGDPLHLRVELARELVVVQQLLADLNLAQRRHDDLPLPALQAHTPVSLGWLGSFGREWKGRTTVKYLAMQLGPLPFASIRPVRVLVSTFPSPPPQEWLM